MTRREHGIDLARRAAQQRANASRRNMVIWSNGTAYEVRAVRVHDPMGQVFVELVRPERAKNDHGMIESFSRDQIKVTRFPDGVSSLSAKADYLARQHGIDDARIFRKLADGYYDLLVQIESEKTHA